MVSERDYVIATWDDLNDVISDYQRGRVVKAEVYAFYREYRTATVKAGEGCYKLANILNDDMPDISPTYPTEKPDFEIDERGYWITPHSLEQAEEAVRRMNQRPSPLSD